jgi:hypothetical protein
MAQRHIRSHARLWDYILDIQDKVPTITAKDDEPLMELFGAVVHYLHPAYSFAYSLEIFELCLEAMDQHHALSLIKKADIQSRLGEVYSRIVAERIEIR